MITTRFATATEGPLLYQLYLASGKSPLEGMDWSVSPVPYWLVAERDGQVVGCVQMRLSQPMAMLELLCIPTTLSKRLKAEVTLALTEAARGILRELGSDYIAFGVDPEQFPEWASVVERRGAVKWFDTPTYLMRT